MRVPIGWLKEYVDILLPLDQLAERLTLAGLEVEAIERIGDWWDRERILVAEIREVRPHPNADRLVLADVAYGGGAVEQCVTGAPNLLQFRGTGPIRLKVAFAMEGAELFDGHQEGFVKTRLKPSKIRGVPSRAMVCSEKELGISEDHEGILILPEDAPVGMALADYLGDAVFEVGLTPNLARCLNVLGVAREVAALTGAQLRYPNIQWLTEGPPAVDLARVEIEDADLCARYIATIIRGVEIGPAPRWMQDRLVKAGMRPISNIVDVTNYVMLEWGQPLHAFDYDKLVARAGGQTPTIIVRRAAPGEVMVTLDGVERRFAENTLLICDTAGPIAVAGVMGGLDTEIDAGTTNILLESANFDLFSIRSTTQALRLPSEASQRFGRGIHSATPEPAARRASELMRVLAGGTIAQGMVDAYPRPAEAVSIDLSEEFIERNLGIQLPEHEIVHILQALEFGVRESGPGSWKVTVPEHRLDCAHPADLVEEVARIHGYDLLPTTRLADRLPPQRANRALELEEQVRDILVGCGLQEIISYSLTTLARESALTQEPGPTAALGESYVLIANPITQDRAVMRQHILSTALESAASNLRFRERVALFELGKVFVLDAGSELPREPRQLAVVLSGVRQERGWPAGEGPELDFFDLKAVVDTLLSRLHVTGVSYSPVDQAPYQPGRAARVRSGGIDLGTLGEIHPDVRAALDLPHLRVAAAELDLEAILSQVPLVWKVEPVSAYPAALQDLAVVVDEAVPAGSVRALILETGGSLLRDVTLFDVYRGEPVPPGRKSLAYALSFQAADRTLSDETVAKQVKRIVSRLGRELGAELRQ